MGPPLTISVDYPGRAVSAQVWRVEVGRVPLYLLDTNIAGQSRAGGPGHHGPVYGGDLDMRIKQEILLGIGGCRALEALGLQPTVCHMNEGHSAFLAAGARTPADGDQAAHFRRGPRAGLLRHFFTGHTPVMAGHDCFPPDLMDRYFGSYMRAAGHQPGRVSRPGPEEPGGRRRELLHDGAGAADGGLQQRRQQAARPGQPRDVAGLWPGVPEDEIPIGHVTNGVHFRSWISYEMNHLYNRYLGPDWREQPSDEALWKRAETIPAEELWRSHERRRERLVAFARRKLRAQLERRGAAQTGDRSRRRGARSGRR